MRVNAQFTEAEAEALGRYFTNLDRPVFALRNLPEVVKGALFSRYSRTEKSLRRVLLDEFINEPESGFERLAGGPASTDDDMVAVRRAEEFYERVLVGYGDDSVAELAGAHVAVERVSTLAAKALEDSRIGISPLEKSTRYVRFDRPGPDGRRLYHRGTELSHPAYEPAAERLVRIRTSLQKVARRTGGEAKPGVRLLSFDADAERKVVQAALYTYSDTPLDSSIQADPDAVLEALLGGRANRRQRAPRALERAQYEFEIVANFAAYRDLHRHRMLTQERQLLGTSLGYDLPPALADLGMDEAFRRAMDSATAAHQRMEADIGPALAQYVVPLAYRVRWYFRVNLRELYHLCELRTTPQGHPDYRFVAQEMFRLASEVHPRLHRYPAFVDKGAGDELERRKSERRWDEKLRTLGGPVL